MKIQELSVGNYLQNTNGNIGKVIGITEQGEVIMRYAENSTCYSEPAMLKPVPITPEILEKSGWEPYKEELEGGYKGFTIEDENENLVQYVYPDGGVTVWWEQNIVSDLIGVNYVHELQNLLNLHELNEFTNKMTL